MYLPYVFLAVAIAAVWLPSFRFSTFTVRPWQLIFLAATLTGLVSGGISWLALAPLGLLAGAVQMELGYLNTPSASITKYTSWRIFYLGAAVLISLGLALHLFPGFNNHLLISGVTVGASTVPIKQYLNFDKGAAGLLLLIYCTRCRTGTDFLRMLKPTALVVAIGCVVVFAIASLSGAIRPDLKWPTFAIQFLATNFFFTCIAEEAFFRGLLQARLRKLFPESSIGGYITVLLSAVLFGLTHLAGGPSVMAFAALAGVTYAAAFHITGRIEAAILLHFAINAIHFVAFTYPQIPLHR
jgi:uncharacterized protein